YETPYVDDKKHGLMKVYYETGKIAVEIPYVDDKEHGLEKQYYPSGQLFMETPYVEGEQIGAIKVYYETGEILGEMTLNGDILTAKGYDLDGTLISCILYNDGVESGSCMP
ncbi:MAG: hypothetical protein DRQ62_04365, partial [Gammaproteobacteria bacterium]